jgi:coenzyme F420 hydrogenase subunit beta
VDEEIKSFKDLILEVQERGICGRCGGCVSFCSAGEFNAIRMDEDAMPRWVDEEKCLNCGICYLICPQIRVLNRELAEKYGWKPAIGPYRGLASARSTSEEVREVATDGGVVTSLLLHALKKRLIDAAVVSEKIGPFRRQSVIVTEPEELIAAAGSHYDESLHLDEIGKKYTTFSPTIREVGSLGSRDLNRMALVGTPCQIYTVRKMQLLNVLPADTVILTIGLFCMENFSFDTEARARLEQKLKMKLGDVKKLNIKDDVIVTTGGNVTIHVPFEALDEVARPACFACADFANDYADISCGGLGSPDGYTTTVIRSAMGEKVYNGAKQAGAIEELRFSTPEQRKIHKTEMMAKIVSFARKKEQRARHTLEAA